MKRIGKDIGPHKDISPVLPFTASITQVAGTNVVRVPFGVCRPRRHRPRRREGPTLVLCLTANLTPTPPPQAA